jgi:DNA polymerase
MRKDNQMSEFTDDLFDPDPNLFDPRFVSPRGPSKGVFMYIVGDVPGIDEAEQGSSFVGKAGSVLELAISKVDADLAKIRFFYVIPYRPINRTPGLDEITKYSAFLRADIRKVKPRMILLAGRLAMAAFGINVPVDEAKANSFQHNGIPVFITIDPSPVSL